MTDAADKFTEMIANLPEPQPPTELDRLRIRCANQRRELRRLNKQVAAFWKGAQFSDHCAFRAKMIRAFGSDAVNKAEFPK